jgi:phosphopantetheine adenylyltransferase
MQEGGKKGADRVQKHRRKAGVSNIPIKAIHHLSMHVLSN